MLAANVLWSIVTLFVAVLQAGVTAVVAEPEDAPKIIVAPTDQKVLENSIASFFCRATGNPPPEVYWRRGGKRITPGHQRYLVVNLPQSSGAVLRIEPAKPRRDDSVFECVAENGIGESAVATAKLEVYPDGNVPSGYPRIVESPTLKAVEKDRNTVMVCSASGTPEPTITWLKDYLPVDVTDPRLRVLPTGSLQIRQSLESDEGKYECVAENVVGAAYSYGANLYVRVRRVPPHFSIPPDSVEVMPGGDVNLTCVAIGSPMPFVKWRMGAIEMTPEDNVPIGKNVLMLKDVRESATYTCVAASDLGNIEAEAEVRVKAMPKAPIHVQSSDVTAQSVRLSWQPAVDDTSSAVESYIIQYRRKYAPGTTYDEVTDIVGTEYQLTGLNAFTTYEMRVIAVNNIGRGLPSPFIDISTGEMLPGSPPHNVRARPVSSTTVVVQWEEPQQPNGIIRGYKVYYTLSPDLPASLWFVQLVDNSQLTTISNLLTNRTYSIAVRAYGGLGDGPLSAPVMVKTQQGVPGQPPNLQGSALSPTSIQLTWDHPDDSGENLLSYELYYNDSMTRRGVHVTISPPTNSYLLTDLGPNTVYHIRVAGKSLRGEGVPTPIIQVRTQEFGQ